MIARISHLAHCAFGAALFLSMTPLQAATRQEVAQKQASWPQAFADSRTLFALGKYEQAEKLLFDLNRNQSGTSEWNLESASALVRMAFSFRQTGDVPLSIVIAERALDQLVLAQKSLKTQADSTLAASIAEMAGLINERLAGTTERPRHTIAPLCN